MGCSLVVDPFRSRLSHSRKNLNPSILGRCVYPELTVLPSKKIALLVNPLTLESKGGAHGPTLAQLLQARGHRVRGFGAPGSAFPGLEVPEDSSGGVAAYEPDFIVAYDALSPAAWVGARAARKLQVPLVLVEAGFAGDGPLHERFLRKAGEAMWGRYIRNTASRIVALDPFAFELARSEGFRSEDLSVLPGGVDLETFRPGLSNPILHKHRVRGRILLYVGRIDERRGLEVLIDAFAATVGQRSDWSLVLAGEGPGLRRLRARVDRLGVGDRVRWLRGPDREGLPGLMCSSTLLAVPAIDNSVRGKQIARAMACGVPVLASDLPRFTRLVKDDENGLLATASDVDSWVQVLTRACGSPEARKRWGARGREIAETELAWPLVAGEFEEVLVQAALRSEYAIENGEPLTDPPSLDSLS